MERRIHPSESWRWRRRRRRRRKRPRICGTELVVSFKFLERLLRTRSLVFTAGESGVDITTTGFIIASTVVVAITVVVAFCSKECFLSRASRVTSGSPRCCFPEVFVADLLQERLYYLDVLDNFAVAENYDEFVACRNNATT